MNKLFLIFFYSLFSFYVNGQSVEDDLKRLEASFEKVTDIYLEMENNVYSKGKKTNSEKGIIRKQGGNYLYELENMTMLVNEKRKYIVMVNHSNYSIAFDNWSPEKAKQLAGSYVPSTKDLLKTYPTVHFKGEVKNQKHYVFENDQQQMSKIEIFFDKKTGLAKRTIYHYNPKVVRGEIKMELLLDKVDLKPTFSSITFSEEQFIQIKGDKITPSAKYQNYSVHDLRMKK